jgi:hypothetical protein
MPHAFDSVAIGVHVSAAETIRRAVGVRLGGQIITSPSKPRQINPSKICLGLFGLRDGLRRELHHRSEAVQLQLRMAGAAVDRPFPQHFGNGLPDALAGDALLVGDFLIAVALAQAREDPPPPQNRTVRADPPPLRGGSRSPIISNSPSATASVAR